MTSISLSKEPEPVKRLFKTLDSHNISYHPEEVLSAVRFARDYHGTQTRASGDPYYYHPVEVAEILAEMRMDNASIITAILHDTVEDTDATLEDIASEFGEPIAQLVDGVTKLTKLEGQSASVRQAENFRKLLVAISEDIRVLLVKLADRLHNMRTLHYIGRPEKRVRIAQETMEIFAPLAERIGMQNIKDELQNIAFKEIHPDGYESIISRLEYLRKSGSGLVDTILQDVRETLSDGGLKEAEVYGREKRPYSIWRKMERKNVSFEQLSDIMAFRILVDNVEQCYQALGLVHAKYHMVPNTFKDFISTPKANGYQSLHTVVMGPEQQRVEIQLRTHEMHDIAEYGVAAHWTYKQKRTYSTDGKQYRWIRELLFILEHAAEPDEFLENTKLEMYHDQVFCFTPKGMLVALPNGATPVDFAYAVHSDVGHSCVGAKVNGRIVPLRTVLQNGDQVEIIRSKSHNPSPTWENYVVTGKAKSAIRRFIRSQQRDEYVRLGHSILEKALESVHLELDEKRLEQALDSINRKSVEDVYAHIGEGLLSKTEVAHAMYPELKEHSGEKRRSLLERLTGRKSAGKAVPTGASVPVKGLIPGMAVHLAGCCHPLPGDNIVGIVNSGKGITIHTRDCEELDNFVDMPERWIDVSWEDASVEQKTFVGRLKAVLSHEAGSLGILSNTIAKDGGNINNLKIIHRSADFFELLIDVEVKDIKHLATVMASLRSKSCVYSVERYQ